MGLVETGVGVVPAGGGCKEVLWRWSQTDEAKKDPDYAPLQVFNIIGYAKTATSTVEALPLKFLRPEDKKVMNRNSLFEEAKKLLEENKNFQPPKEVQATVERVRELEIQVAVLQTRLDQLLK